MVIFHSYGRLPEGISGSHMELKSTFLDAAKKKILTEVSGFRMTSPLSTMAMEIYGEIRCW